MHRFQMKNWLKSALALMIVVILTACSNKPKTDSLPQPPALQYSAPMQKTTLVDPASDEHPEVPRTLARSAFHEVSPAFVPKMDILKRLGITIENEFDGEFGITNETIRGAADMSYARLGIADPSIKGWKLTVRPADGGVANTFFNTKTHRITININQAAWSESAPHEMTHALEGIVIWEHWLPGILREFVATAAEDVDAKEKDFPFTYDQFNRTILATGKTVDHREHQINANNAPLDAVRYDLLRAGGLKIGAVAYRELAREVHSYALARHAAAPLEEFKPAFERAGLGDCVLFNQSAIGLFLDVSIMKSGVPIIMYKQVDQNGVETSPMATIRTVWRKSGKAITSWTGGTNPAGILIDQSGAFYAPHADAYEVTLGQTSYTYNIDGAPTL